MVGLVELVVGLVGLVVGLVDLVVSKDGLGDDIDVRSEKNIHDYLSYNDKTWGSQRNRNL